MSYQNEDLGILNTVELFRASLSWDLIRDEVALPMTYLL